MKKNPLQKEGPHKHGKTNADETVAALKGMLKLAEMGWIDGFAAIVDYSPITSTGFVRGGSNYRHTAGSLDGREVFLVAAEEKRRA